MKKKIFVRAPVLTQSGYGEQSRFALRALRSRQDLFDIYIQPIAWGKTGWLWQDDEFRQWMDERILETQLLLQEKNLNPDMSLQITIPNEFEKICPINIGYTAGIETDRVAPIWLQKGNDMDKILVVSNHAKETYEATSVTLSNGQVYRLEKPTEVVWENTPMADAIEEIPNFSPKHDFNFLLVSQMSPRKNFANTLKWFVEEFQDKEVGLVIKTHVKGCSKMDLEGCESSLKSILSAYPNRKCSVSLLHGELSNGQMRGLYEHDKVKCLINIAHGEGFGLPLFEAARSALPIITIGWSGQTDFLRHDGKDYFLKVSHKLDKIQDSVVWNGVLQPEQKWAYADEASFKAAIKVMFNKHKNFIPQALELQQKIKEKFSDEVLYEKFCNAILEADPVEQLIDLEAML